MASIRFDDNWISVNLDPSATTIELIKGTKPLPNIKKSPESLEKVSGSSWSVVVRYENNDPSPRTFSATQCLTFPSGAPVNITGGGKSNDFVEAADNLGHKGTWSITGEDLPSDQSS
ncbi:hypothetical protein F5B19DRAFT_496324 [Rostrohypoxylon terebratum]|nr:hypothetical protein F5B19DRAFT_496324 [Rostrohypoxylon terebratum]